VLPAERVSISQVELRSWFIKGSERLRFPVAAKNAFSTAGAATAITESLLNRSSHLYSVFIRRKRGYTTAPEGQSGLTEWIETFP